MTESSRQQLKDLRSALLSLHKTLVESERVAYEKTVGSIESPNHFLKLLLNDPWFAWLQPLSQLVVAMDEALEAKTPLTDVIVESFIKQTGQLLVATEAGEGFSQHYFEALQRDPDVVMAHAEAAKFFKPQRPAK